jgi:hypothetical protein
LKYRNYFDEGYIGSRLGSFEVVGIHKSEFGRAAIWDCKCSKCGKVISVVASEAINGRRLQCECGNTFSSKESYDEWKFSNLDTIRLRKIYRRMLSRCYNENDRSYKLYGGAGISVCLEWLVSFNNFVGWAIANGYKPWLDLKRKNNKYDFSPENCYWGVINCNDEETCINSEEIEELCREFGLDPERVKTDVQNGKVNIVHLRDMLSRGNINKSLKNDIKKLARIRGELVELGTRLRAYSYVGKAWPGIEHVEKDVDTCIYRLSSALNRMIKEVDDSE